MWVYLSPGLMKPGFMVKPIPHGSHHHFRNSDNSSHISTSIYCYCVNVTAAIPNGVILLFSSRKNIKLQKNHLIFWLVVSVLFTRLVSTSFSKMTVWLRNGNKRLRPLLLLQSKVERSCLIEKYESTARYCGAWNKYWQQGCNDAGHFRVKCLKCFIVLCKSRSIWSFIFKYTVYSRCWTVQCDSSSQIPVIS